MTDNTITNCTKCGNPLNPGTTTCPVCGTPVGMEQVATPVNIQEQPVANTSTQAAPTIAPTIQPTASVAQPNLQPVQPTPAPPLQPIEPVAPIAPVAQEAPVQPVQNANLNTIAPTISTAAPNSAIPSVAPVDTPTVNPSVVQSNPSSTKKKLKLKINNKTLIIILVVIILICGAFVLLKGKGGKTNVNKPATKVEETAPTKDVVTNGFRFKVEEDWIVQSNSDNTVITNANGTVIVKLENYAINFSNITKASLETNFNDLGNEFNPNKIMVRDVSVNENKIASKDGYLVNAIVSEDDGKEYNAQYYFINGGSELVVGASVVYTTDEVKTSNEGKVTTLLNNLSYVNDSNTIISIINKNYRAFSVYYNAVNGVTLNIPTPEDPSLGGEVEQPVA